MLMRTTGNNGKEFAITANAANAFNSKPLMKEITPKIAHELDRFAIKFCEASKRGSELGMRMAFASLRRKIKSVAKQNKEFEYKFYKKGDKGVSEMAIMGIELASKGKPFCYVEIKHCEERRSIAVSTYGDNGFSSAHSYAFYGATRISEKMQEFATKLLNLKAADGTLALSV